MDALLLAVIVGAPPGGWLEACAEADWDKAYELASQAVAEDSTSADAWAGAAIAAVRGGIESNALDWAGRALMIDSLSPVAWTARGTVLRLADPCLAEDAFRTAMELDGSFAPAVEGLALVLFDRGEFAGSAELLGGLLEGDDTYRPAFLPLVQSLSYAGFPDEALAKAMLYSGRHPDDPDLALELGFQLEEAGRPDSAAVVYEGLTASDPGNVEALRRLGLIREDLGDFGGAVKLYRAVIEADPGYSWAYGELAWCLEAVGLVELAGEWYTKGLEIDPEYSWAAYRMGLLVEQEGLADSARTWFETALSIDPLMSEAWVSLGLMEEDAGNPELAVLDYRRALEADPSDAWTWGELGFVYSGLGMTGEAGEAYESSVAVDPTYQWGWEQRGLLFEDTGEDEGAIGWYVLAANSAAQSSWLLGELGMLLERSGRTDSAAVVYRSAIEADSLYSFGLQRLARIERSRGDGAAALDLLERYRTASADHGVALLEMSMIRRAAGEHAAADSLEALAFEADPAAAEDLAWSFFYNDMHRDAIEAGLLAASVMPDDPATILSMCDLLSLAGDAGAADSISRAAAGEHPDDPAMWSARGTFLSSAERYAEASEAFTAAYSLDSTSYEAASYLGEAYLFQDMYPEAELWLERSLEIDPQAVFSICYLGLIRERLGDPSGALDHYLHALRINPGYAYAEERVRFISDPSYDVGFWRSESRPFSTTIWADVSMDRGNGEESSYSGGAEAAWIYGPRGSRVNAEFRGNLERIYDKERENSAWASLGMDYFVTGVLYLKAHGSWDRQPATVRPWQVSSYASLGYREWITDWLYVSPEAGVGMVSSQWFLEEKQTDDWTSYLSMGLWMSRDDSLLPSLWLGAGLYLPPDDTDDYIANGNAELTFEAMDRLSFTVGCNLDYTNRPVISSWEQLDSEVYSRISLSLF